MMDIVQRLRRWVHDVDAVSASDLMDEAADVIESTRGGVFSFSDRRPVEKTKVLAFDAREHSWRIAYWEVGEGWHMVGFDHDTPIVVSHWAPLPPLP